MLIFDDPDVARVYNSATQLLSLEDLESDDYTLMTTFVAADMDVGDFTDAAAILRANVLGVQAVERFDETLPVGWAKFVTFQVGCNTEALWERHHRSDEAGAFANWVRETIEHRGWGPDGNSSALGTMHGSCMSIAAQTVGAHRRNPQTGSFEVMTGDSARRIAGIDVPPPADQPDTVAPVEPARRGFLRRRT